MGLLILLQVALADRIEAPETLDCCPLSPPGTTMFPGIADRMNKEITARAPTSMKVKVRTLSYSCMPEQD